VSNRYLLKPQPFLPQVLIAVLVIAPIGYLIPWYRDVQAGESRLPGLAFGLTVYTMIVGLIVVIRYLTWARNGQVITLAADHIDLPLSAGSRRSRRVAYEDLLSLGLMGGGPGSRLLIGSRTRTFLFAARHFEGGLGALEDLRVRLREAIASRPDGMTQLKEMDERERLGARLMRTPPRLTLAILAVLAAVYFATLTAGALEPQFRLVRFGANVSSLVANGEWYRLFAANFLHANLLHIYMNGMGLFVLGGLLERMLGPWRFITVYLVSALGGALASAWAALALLSVGASTAVFGLLGSLAVLNWRFRAVLPGGFRQPLRWWVIILGINGLLPIIAPMIDYWGHIGGFAAGAAITSLLCRDEQCLRPPQVVSAPIKALTSALVILCVLSLAEAATHATTSTGPAAELAVAREFIEQNDLGPIELNAFAWEYATAADVTTAELDVAERAARRAVELNSNEAIVDTLATVFYRQGNLDAAVETEVRVVTRAENREFLSQMGRFLAARLARSGAFYRAGGQGTVSAVRLERGNNGDTVAVVELASEVDQGLEVIALDQVSGGLRGTLRLQIGAGLAPGEHEIPLDARAGGLPAGARLAVGYVDASGCNCAPGTERARYFAMDPEISRLP
jgi:membrane associated rhomboid family serine protease